SGARSPRPGRCPLRSGVRAIWGWRSVASVPVLQQMLRVDLPPGLTRALQPQLGRVELVQLEELDCGLDVLGRERTLRPEVVVDVALAALPRRGQVLHPAAFLAQVPAQNAAHAVDLARHADGAAADSPAIL